MDGSAVIRESIERWQKLELSDKTVTTSCPIHSVTKTSFSQTKPNADVFQSREVQGITNMEELVKRELVAFASLREDVMIANGVGHVLMLMQTNQSKLCADVIIHNDLHRKSEDSNQN